MVFLAELTTRSVAPVPVVVGLLEQVVRRGDPLHYPAARPEPLDQPRVNRGHPCLRCP